MIAQGGKGGPMRAFQPQEIQVGDKTFTATTPQELQSLQAQRLKWQNDQAQMAGAPQRPGFDSMLGADGLIDSRYQIGNFAEDLMSNNQGFNKFQDEALRDGPSKYAQLMLDQQDLNRKGALDDVGAQFQSGLQSQMDALASQGGMMSGAGERMGANSIRDMLAARQGVRRDTDQNRLSIQGQDEQNRLGQLQALTGLEQQRNQTGLQAREFDLRNSLNERDSKRQDGMDAWKTQMETWASNRQADAQAQAARSSCFPRGTMIEMADGTEKKIEDIDINDQTRGGAVTKVIYGSAMGADWYLYKEVIVTGTHMVLEKGKWIRVEDSKLAEPMDIHFDVLFNFSTTNHSIFVNGLEFSDYDEVDFIGLSWEDNEKIRNEEASCSRTIS
jgi:hypothetical protein